MKAYIVSGYTSQSGESSTVALFSTRQKALDWIKQTAEDMYNKGPVWCTLGYYESRPEHKPEHDWFVRQAENEYFIEEYEIDNPNYEEESS